MKNVEVGQKVYVRQYLAFRESKPSISEETVIRVNGTSFYTKQEGFDSEHKLSRKDWTGRSGFGVHYKAYETESEYWNLVEQRKERAELLSQVGDKIQKLSLEELRKFNEFIDGEFKDGR